MPDPPQKPWLPELTDPHPTTGRINRDGNSSECQTVFSATLSVSSYIVAVVSGLGFVVSGRGSQSWGDADHPSCVRPGKRPRLTPNPAWAMTADRIIPFGSPGGDVQTQAMIQVLLNHLEFGMDFQEAADAPRLASYSLPFFSRRIRQNRAFRALRRAFPKKCGAV